MKYARINNTDGLGKSFTPTTGHIATQGPSAAKSSANQALEDMNLAQMIEEGLQSGLATQRETQVCNQLLGLPHEL